MSQHSDYIADDPIEAAARDAIKRIDEALKTKEHEIMQV